MSAPTPRLLVIALASSAMACATVGGPPPAGPTSASVQYRVYDIPCDEAHRIAAKTLKVRGLTITEVNRGPTGGSVKGSKEGEQLEVRVSCAAEGVTVSSSGGHWLDQGVKMSFAGLVDKGDRIWPPPKGPKILVEPLYGPEAKLDFPQELEPLGMTVLRFRIVNGGARAITIEPRRIRGKTESGQAVPALSVDGVKQKLGSAPDLEAKVLRTTTLGQGEEARGFVFLPAARYASIVVWLVDEPTGEADEFEIFLRGS